AMTGAAMKEVAAAAPDWAQPFNPFRFNAIEQAGNALGVVANFGSRGVIAEDEFYKIRAFRASLWEQAYVNSSREFAPGSAEWKTAFQKFINTPPDDAVKIAKEHAAYITMNSQLSESIQGLGKFFHNPAIRPFVPFFNVAANTMAVTFESLPMIE